MTGAITRAVPALISDVQGGILIVLELRLRCACGVRHVVGLNALLRASKCLLKTSRPIVQAQTRLA